MRDYDRTIKDGLKKMVKMLLVVLVIGIVAKLYYFHNEDRYLEWYKNKVKRYVVECEYSDEIEEIICIAVDHIRYPENIGDYRYISIRQAAEFAGERWLFNSGQDEDKVYIEAEDYLVVIGETTYHKYYNAIIDCETLEYLGRIPIA